jgi:hypothetical protein
MSQFQIAGVGSSTSLSGRGLAFNVAALIGEKGDPAERGEKLVEIAEVAYREGRASAILSMEDRFELHGAVNVLRSLAVVVGPNPTGDRHRRMADIISRLLQDQEGGA